MEESADHLIGSMVHSSQHIQQDENLYLHCAIEQADIKEIRRAISIKANINAYNEKGETPLHNLIMGYLMQRNQTQDDIKKVNEIMHILIDT